MKLLATTTSPYARKVLLCAHECGLKDKITFVTTDLASAALAAQNPLNKVPALILDDGTSLFDSPVICEYLDTLHSGPRFFPAPGPARWQALREQALADGICDATVLRMQEGRRPPEIQWNQWVERQTRKMVQGLDEFERTVSASASAPGTIGDLALLATLGYLDLRFPGDAWRGQRPRLSAWFDRVSDRDSFRATVPTP